MTASELPHLPKRRWVEMISREFRDLPPDTVAILPVAAVEQHGPHLPVCVDACINQGLLDLALDRAPAGLPITALPIQAVGKSDEHIAYPGTLTLSAAGGSIVFGQAIGGDDQSRLEGLTVTDAINLTNSSIKQFTIILECF